MIINKQYALFDWDNTVRNGYTLYSWTDYLCTHSIIDSYLQYELNQIKEQYGKKLITHDQYADIACSKYTKALKGLDFKTINDAVLDYMVYDRKYLFKNIIQLFEIFYKKNIDIIVISGAPSIILEKYKDEFHFKAIYAFKEQVSHGIFTGNVEYNYGFDKMKKILDLIKKYKTYPYIALGDSESDLPMLDYASYPFCINNTLLGRNYRNIDPNNISDEILKEIQQL